MRASTKRLTHFPIDKGLVKEARSLGKHRSDIETINAALKEYVRWRKQMRILDLFGTIDFDPTYDYKAERRRKRMGSPEDGDDLIL